MVHTLNPTIFEIQWYLNKINESNDFNLDPTILVLNTMIYNNKLIKWYMVYSVCNIK